MCDIVLHKNLHEIWTHRFFLFLAAQKKNYLHLQTFSKAFFKRATVGGRNCLTLFLVNGKWLQVFFKAGTLGQLEEMRDDKLSKIITWMQSAIRGYHTRKQYKKLQDQR